MVRHARKAPEEPYVPMQGEIVRVGLGSGKGHEPQGRRPFICLSNALVSRFANIALFAPISTTERRYPLYIPLDRGLETDGVVMLDQLVTLDYTARGATYVETVGEAFLDRLLETVKLVFQKD
ncbi:MAG: type II toxin-antitoxin system PemK/MazF family toxin [Clostridiales Family XIII bacterium]|jgi:mRNA interferase MazF|nr:type II toxin-antitoxin system PemK/MazF family toxin [Clostridiales Family XIII bacterium]